MSGIGLSIKTAGIDITPDINVLYLTGMKKIVSKMSDQELSFFSTPGSKVYADWYYARLSGRYIGEYARMPGSEVTSILRRLDVTELVTSNDVVLAITAIPGLPSKSFLYTEDGKYYLRYASTSAANLELTVYAFSSALPEPKDNIGLVMYDSKGRVSFDTSRYPMRLANTSKLSPTSSYAYICQYTQSIESYYGGMHYDRGGDFGMYAYEWMTGSYPMYIDTDYTVKSDVFLTDAWQWYGGDLWDLDDVTDDAVDIYGTESSFAFINVTGY